MSQYAWAIFAGPMIVLDDAVGHSKSEALCENCS